MLVIDTVLFCYLIDNDDGITTKGKHGPASISANCASMQKDGEKVAEEKSKAKTTETTKVKVTPAKEDK